MQKHANIKTLPIYPPSTIFSNGFYLTCAISNSVNSLLSVELDWRLSAGCWCLIVVFSVSLPWDPNTISPTCFQLHSVGTLHPLLQPFSYTFPSLQPFYQLLLHSNAWKFWDGRVCVIKSCFAEWLKLKHRGTVGLNVVGGTVMCVHVIVKKTETFSWCFSPWEAADDPLSSCSVSPLPSIPPSSIASLHSLLSNYRGAVSPCATF